MRFPMLISSLPGANPHFPSTKLAFLCAFASKFFPMVVLRGSLQGTQCRVPRGAATLLLIHSQIYRPICTDCLRHLLISAERDCCLPGCAGATKHHREKAAGRGAPKHHREKAAAGVPQSIIGKSLLAETDQNPHKEVAHKEAAHKRSWAQKMSGTKKPCTKKTVHGEECARDGNRTRTDISAHRILSPACLPIPPLEQCKFRLEGQRYYFLSSYEPFLIYFCNLV